MSSETLLTSAGHSRRAQVEASKKALAADKTAEFKIYPGAPHGFHADYRTSYRKDAATAGIRCSPAQEIRVLS